MKRLLSFVVLVALVAVLGLNVHPAKAAVDSYYLSCSQYSVTGKTASPMVAITVFNASRGIYYAQQMIKPDADGNYAYSGKISGTLPNEYIFMGVVEVTTGLVLDIQVRCGGPGEDMISEIDKDGVVGKFIWDTELLWAPKPEAKTKVTMKAEKTVWVLGLDESGEYWYIAYAGGTYFVPFGSLAPNPDKVWNNHPLPSWIEWVEKK